MSGTKVSEQHEVDLIRSFIRPEKRARLLGFLRSPKGRAKLRASLAHFADLDPRFAHPIPTNKHHARDIVQILRGKGAPNTCYVLSELDELDGRQMLLELPLKEVVGRGMGSFVSCIPGRLGYFESEEAGDRFVLERTV